MILHESGEMYLETIYILSKNNAAVRAVDVGTHMGFSRPSVSRAIALLKKDGLVATDAHGSISLTAQGFTRAKRIYERHALLSQLFKSLGVDEKIAIQDACRVEHYLSSETFEAIKNHVKAYGGALPSDFENEA